MYKAFTMVKKKLQRLREDYSDLYDSDGEYEASHFQISDINFGKSNFQFSQLDKNFKNRIASVFNNTYVHNTGIQTKIDLREVILLDIQLATDIF